MDRIIHQSVVLKRSPEKAFEYFTLAEHLEKWLTVKAEIEPVVGGKYELFWNPEDRANNSTIGCKILAMEMGKLLCFEWKGAFQFKHFMNNVRPLTNVAVFFLPHPEGAEVQLLHTGWRDTEEWEEAWRWFDEVWEKMLTELKKYCSA